MNSLGESNLEFALLWCFQKNLASAEISSRNAKDYEISIYSRDG
jgi:hypothetical protein